jgi:hypothetical protein
MIKKQGVFMKKSRLVSLLLLLIFVMTIAFVSAKQEIKFTESSFDIYGIRFRKPADWETEVRAEVCVITNPADQNVQLIYLETNEEFAGILDDYLREYKKTWIEPENMKILSERPFEIAGMGAYYLKIDSGKKHLGHILFLRNRKVYALGLKTGRNNYDRYEPVLMEAARSFRFLRTK